MQDVLFFMLREEHVLHCGMTEVVDTLQAELLTGGDSVFFFFLFDTLCIKIASV